MTSSPFWARHIGPAESDQTAMLKTLGLSSLDELVRQTVPKAIRYSNDLPLPAAVDEHTFLSEIKHIASQNAIFESFIGMGYYDCITPTVIQRNILENPGWYTAYTPYQAEIAQGRMEALINFQTMVADLTGFPIANASLLDEGTAAAEAINMCVNASSNDSKAVFVSSLCHPQTIAVVKTRALPLGIEVIVGDHHRFTFEPKVSAVLLQYPATDGSVEDYTAFIEKAHANGAMSIVAADLLSLTLLKEPAAMGADIAVGSTQRFGVPMGFGGPHAAYLATSDAHKRLLPGRLVGISIDSQGNPAYRLSLQTREQHIRRAKATSNICTAQVLLAVMASMYAVYHGPKGLTKIAHRIASLTETLRQTLTAHSVNVQAGTLFDTLTFTTSADEADGIMMQACHTRINLRRVNKTTIGISLGESSTLSTVATLVTVITGKSLSPANITLADVSYPTNIARKEPFLTHPVFNRYHSEHEMLRYIRRLESKDLSLTTSMIPLGSCTMKLNATTEMMPVTWPEFANIHPFAPADQSRGYATLARDLEQLLATITGFDAVSLQPNAGSQGEYAGLLAIRAYHAGNGDTHRTVCLIPNSAHGTNPASAVMAGFSVVGVACDDKGNIDVSDLQKKINEHANNLGALMITYPSTHGVFEESICDICEMVHRAGGQVYMDGANMNAQVALCRPGDFGPDLCHLNLHKTFCIPHGGGGPGVGPIAVKSHLAPYLPSHPLTETSKVGPVCAAPFGSASILPISYAYIRMMGGDGLKKATQVALLNANYMAKRLDPYYPVLFKGTNGMVAHECIIDLRPLKAQGGIEVEDVAKRLMDYGFHAPTISWPIAGTMMIEPTESESLAEIDRFCDALIAIYQEAQEIIRGKADKTNNVLKNAPHTAAMLMSETWDKPYSRKAAAYPAPWLRDHKYWPPVGRVNNPHGDRHLICTCSSVEEMSK